MPQTLSFGDFSLRGGTMNIENFNTGDIITFGNYPQSADGKENAQIKWIVLENTGSELFLLSKCILDCKRYHGKTADITWWDAMDTTWDSCDLRSWLNNEFYKAAFNDNEKKLIKTTICKDNGVGCPDTEDKVFLLSVNEIKDTSDKLGKDFIRTIGTDFAKNKKADGCNLYVYDKSKKVDYVNIDGKEMGCSWWWLRTQGNKPSRAYFMGTGASIRSYANVSSARDGVRPALKIRLDKD